jgi:hypothetical protein
MQTNSIEKLIQLNLKEDILRRNPFSISTHVEYTRYEDISSKGTLEYELFKSSFLNIIRIWKIWLQ